MFLFRMSPTAAATGHSHILNPTHRLQNVFLATPLKESLCDFALSLPYGTRLTTGSAFKKGKMEKKEIWKGLS